MFLSNDFLQRWEHIIDDIEMTEIPIECIKKITLNLSQRKRKTINVAALRNKGFDFDEIETEINKIMLDFDDEIRDVQFTVDIEAVAEIVQPYTDKLLKKL